VGIGHLSPIPNRATLAPRPPFPRRALSTLANFTLAQTINNTCEGIGASLWWPNKDQWRDEVESMDISVEIPSNLVEVSNGRFTGKSDLGDGYTQWNWRVHDIGEL